MLWAQWGEYALAEWTEVKKKIELSPRLGLETICIAPFCGRTNLTTRACVRSLGMEMGRC